MLSLTFPLSSSSIPSTCKPTISALSPVSSLVAIVCSLSKYAAVKLKSSEIAHFTPTSLLSYTSGSKAAADAVNFLYCSPDLGKKLSL